LTLADIENNTEKWQKLQQYYDKDEEVLKVPITYTFNNSVHSSDNLQTDKSFAVMNVSDDIKEKLRNLNNTEQLNGAKQAVEEAKTADGKMTGIEKEITNRHVISKTNGIKVLPEAGQGSQPTTLFGSLFAGLGALLFFRKRKEEKLSK
ncbi:hypothetical protein TP70_03530, partial [Staphylococcus microti]